MPAITQNQIQKHFKNLGKLINLARKSLVDAPTYRLAISGLNDQIATGVAADADVIFKVGIPATNGLNAIAVTLDGLRGSAKSWATTYLTQIVAVDLGLAAGASLSSIGTALVASMQTPASGTAQTVAASGSDNYCTYFNQQFAINLPTAGSPTISDAWICTDPV